MELSKSVMKLGKTCLRVRERASLSSYRYFQARVATAPGLVISHSYLWLATWARQREEPLKCCADSAEEGPTIWRCFAGMLFPVSVACVSLRVQLKLKEALYLYFGILFIFWFAFNICWMHLYYFVRILSYKHVINMKVSIIGAEWGSLQTFVLLRIRNRILQMSLKSLIASSSPVLLWFLIWFLAFLYSFTSYVYIPK